MRMIRRCIREYIRLDEIEDGHPIEDLDAFQDWLKERFQKILSVDEFVH